MAGKMDIISRRIGKVLEVGGSSLAVPMRGELIDYGLDKGDTVLITLTHDMITIERLGK